MNLSCPTISTGLCVSRLGRSKVCHFAQFANGGPPSSDCSSAWWPVERPLASLSTSNPFAFPLRRVSPHMRIPAVLLLLWRVWGGRTLTFPCLWRRVRPCLGRCRAQAFSALVVSSPTPHWLSCWMVPRETREVQEKELDIFGRKDTFRFTEGGRNAEITVDLVLHARAK